MSAFGHWRTNLCEPKCFGPVADKPGCGLIVRFVPIADNPARLFDHFTRRGSRRSHRSLELALNSSTPLRENTRTQLPPDRLIHHCIPFVLLYGRKRAKIDLGSWGLSDRVECCVAFRTESRRTAATH